MGKGGGEGTPRCVFHTKKNTAFALRGYFDRQPGVVIFLVLPRHGSRLVLLQSVDSGGFSRAWKELFCSERRAVTWSGEKGEREEREASGGKGLHQNHHGLHVERSGGGTIVSKRGPATR